MKAQIIGYPDIGHVHLLLDYQMYTGLQIFSALCGLGQIILEQIENLEKKIKQVVELLARLKEENKRLKEEFNFIEQENKRAKQLIKDSNIWEERKENFRIKIEKLLEKLDKDGI